MHRYGEDLFILHLWQFDIQPTQLHPFVHIFILSGIDKYVYLGQAKYFPTLTMDKRLTTSKYHM